MDHTLEGASTADQPRPAPATLQPPSLQSVPQPPGIPSPMGAPPPMPYPYYPLVPNPNGGMAPPRPLYTQGAPYFTIVGENEPLPPPVSPIGAQFPPYGMPPFAGGVPPPLNPGAMAAYAFPAMLSGPGGPSGIHGGPTSSFVRPYNQSATPISELGLGQLVNGRGQAGEEDLSPKAIRKLSHNAVEARCPLPAPTSTICSPSCVRSAPFCVPAAQPSARPCATQVRRRRRISTQLDRLKTMLNRRPPPLPPPPCLTCACSPLPCPRRLLQPARPALTPHHARCLSPKADKASLLSEAVKRLTLLTKRCHSLETELAMFKGTEPPPPPVPSANQLQLQPPRPAPHPTLTLPRRSRR